MTLFDTFLSALGANPLLAGGVGTLAFGGVLYVLRAVPQALLDLLEKKRLDQGVRREPVQ